MKTLKKVIFAYILLFIFVDGSTHIKSNHKIVNTTNGYVEGLSENNYYVFKGIPFAEPPIRNLRWQPPISKASWSPNIFQATTFGPACPQLGVYSGFFVKEMSEDCLYLNIWTPLLPDSNLNFTSLPVMVFIYGGGWTQGYGSHPLYWGDFIANSTNTIIVTFNYRLGALGFLVNDKFNGNFGIQDQRLALIWIKNNIHYFGGNNQKITLFGQSAGAISVSVHMTSIISQQLDLFQQAIIESNPFLLEFRSLEEDKTYGDIFSILLGCFIGDIECLLNKTVDEILSAQGDTIWLPLPISTKDDLPWQPVIDGVDIIGSPLQQIQAGNYTKLPVIIGTVRNETLSFLYGTVTSNISSFEYESLIAFWFNFNAQEVLNLYPSVDGDNRGVLSQLTTDYFFTCPTRLAAIYLNKFNSDIPVYLYEFVHSPYLDPMNNSTYCKNEVCHGAELGFVFHSSAFDNFPFHNSEESQLSLNMMNYWTTFSYNPYFLDDNKLPIQWPQYNLNDVSLEFNLNISITQDYHSIVCNFWDQLSVYY